MNLRHTKMVPFLGHPVRSSAVARMIFKSYRLQQNDRDPPSFHSAGSVIVRPLSTVGYTSVVASVIHSSQWSN